MGYDFPFAGLKVVDISQGVAGPYTGMLMAQYGANVIKVEPHEGDWGRRIARNYDGHSAFSVPANLGKRCIALDMKAPEGRDIVLRMAQEADLFIEGFRPGVADRLGVGHDALAAINPRLLYLSISGFGQTGPLRERPAMDPVLQAFSGFMSANKGVDGIPHRVGVIVCDMGTALYAFQAVSTALYARRDEKLGRRIEANLMQGIACLQAARMISNYKDGGRMTPGRVPSGTFPTADGWIDLLIFKEEEFPAFCRILGRDDLAQDARFATNALRVEHEADLTPALNDACGRIDGATLSKGLAGARIMHERVNDFLDFLKHPQVEETGLITWLDHSGIGRIPMPNVPGLKPLTDGSPLSAAPGIGAHYRTLLREHRYSPADIEALLSRNVVKG